MIVRPAIVAFALVAAGCAPSAPYVPGEGDDWRTIDAAEAGFDEAALDEAIQWALANETTMPRDPGQYLRDRFAGQRWQEIVGPTSERGGVNGILLKDGRIVAEWGDTRRPDMTFSVTKSYLSTVVGLAWDQGLIPNLDAPVGELVRDGGFDSPHNSQITWRHHLQQLSEWEGTLFGKPDSADRRRGVDRDLQPPGTFWEYNDVRVNRLALSALRVFGEPLPDVLRREVMDPIGASNTWEWNGYETSVVDVAGDSVVSVSGGGHWGGGMVISTRDHARFGLLMSRRGLWGERRLVSEEWIDQALEPSIQPDYGFMWWLNTDRQRFPSAPESSFFALGAGSTSTIWVDPDNDLVMVSRWLDNPQVDELIGRVLAAMSRGGSGPSEGAGPTEGPGPSEDPGPSESARPSGSAGTAALPVQADGFRVGVTSPHKRVYPRGPSGSTSPRQVARISLARNEVEATQVVVRADRPLSELTVTVDPLVGPAGTLDPASVEVLTVGFVELSEPRFAGSRAGWVPDPLFPAQVVSVASGEHQSFLVSVHADAQTAPGEYRGTVRVASADAEVAIDLVVEVWDLELPATPRFKTAALTSWKFPMAAWPTGLPARDDGVDPRIGAMLDLADLGYDYRLPPSGLASGWYGASDGGGDGMVAGFPTHDEAERGLSFFNPERTDLLLDYMLDRGANHFFIAFTGNVRHPPDSAADRTERLTTYLADYRQHLYRRGLLDQAYVYGIDEPWGEEVDHARQVSTAIAERVGADLRVMQNTNQNNADAVPDLVGFSSALDINLGYWDATGVADVRTRTPVALSDLWWNVNAWPESRPNLFLEHPLIDARVIGPMSYAYGVQGFEYWDLLWTGGLESYRPVAAGSLRLPWGVGPESLDGTLVYPAEDGAIHPSLRLTALRDGFEDVELLYLLEDAAPGHDLLDVPIVRDVSSYDEDASAYAAFRAAVADAILIARGATSSPTLEP